MITYILSLPLLALIAHPLSTPDTPFPQSVPPLVGTAILGHVSSDEWSLDLTLPQARWTLEGEIRPKSEWPRLRCDVQKISQTVVFQGLSALAEARLVDIHGKPIPQDVARRQFRKEHPVLVSLDGKMIDAYYLQIARADSMILILGPREGAPRPGLLPAQHGSPDIRARGGDSR